MGPKKIKMECLLMGRNDSREITHTFTGENKPEIKKKADFYAAQNDLEILFFQQPEVSVDGFWGGVYAA